MSTQALEKKDIIARGITNSIDLNSRYYPVANRKFWLLPMPLDNTRFEPGGIENFSVIQKGFSRPLSRSVGKATTPILKEKGKRFTFTKSRGRPVPLVLTHRLKESPPIYVPKDILGKKLLGILQEDPRNMEQREFAKELFLANNCCRSEFKFLAEWLTDQNILAEPKYHPELKEKEKPVWHRIYYAFQLLLLQPYTSAGSLANRIREILPSLEPKNGIAFKNVGSGKYHFLAHQGLVKRVCFNGVQGTTLLHGRVYRHFKIQDLGFVDSHKSFHI